VKARKLEPSEVAAAMFADSPVIAAHLASDRRIPCQTWSRAGSRPPAERDLLTTASRQAAAAALAPTAGAR